MTLRTITKTAIIERLECSEYNDDNDTEDLNLYNSQRYQQKDAYDQMLPKNDLSFMAPVRKWEKRMGFITPIRWINLIIISLSHVTITVWFLHTIIFYPKLFQLKDLTYAVLSGVVAGFGVTGGAHRFWSHKTFKAKWPLKIILAICFSASGQNTIYEWVRDHRVHHKYSETVADPHDANRGFFFSHVGWLMMKKHPEVLRQGVKIDMSDITSDPIVQFHNRYFIILKIMFCFIIPTVIPIYFLGTSWYFAMMSQLVRYIITLNSTWSVNSFAHLWGNKPYDRNIMPVENYSVSFMALGEGWHNYHHTFPWDYKAAELPYATNLTTVILDAFATIGWAYDLKVAPQSLINTVIENRGDKSHSQHRLYNKCDNKIH